jgi:hypothetical protein
LNEIGAAAFALSVTMARTRQGRREERMVGS